MAIATKVLGQSAPGATTLTDIYTVPGATKATISSLFVCNRGGASTTFRVSLAVAGAADATSQYIFYDITISGNDTFVATTGITLAATDVLRVFAGNANLTFTATGIEET